MSTHVTISTFPARIHILLARDEPIAVVIRRGPSKQVCTLLWNRRDDTFTLDQWLKGRIYEHRLIWTKQCHLDTGCLSKQGLKEEQVIYDFNPLKFEPRQAPY